MAEELRIAMVGARGRMGRAVADVLAESDDARLALAVDREAGDGVLGLEALVISSADVDVAIDFTHASSAVDVFEACAGMPLVTGTTGLDEEGRAALEKLATVQPVVHAPNMSVGVNLLFHLAKVATELAGEGFDAEIVEMHHRHKTDAPSGTAARLAEVVSAAKELGPEAWRFGRSGQVGARTRDEIGVMTLRGGSVIGDHTLYLAGSDEVLELTHRAGSRSIFARGAVHAARWVRSRPPGLYSMSDVLGIS